ncbi:Abi-alpha family protein [Leptothrix sp. BB-4]
MSIEEDASKAAIDSIGKVAGAIYSDVASPAAKEFGTAIETVFKIGLSPVAMLGWGFEQSKEWLRKKIEKRLSETPPAFRTSPSNQISMQSITQIAMSHDAPELRELYAELLLKAMDTRTRDNVHPSYISLISQLTPQEALIFVSFGDRFAHALFDEDRKPPHFAAPGTIEGQFSNYCRALGFGSEYPVQLWLENLQRLNLVSLETVTEVEYKRADEDSPSPWVSKDERRFLYMTEYGSAFLNACTPQTVPDEA